MVFLSEHNYFCYLVHVYNSVRDILLHIAIRSCAYTRIFTSVYARQQQKTLHGATERVVARKRT